MQDPDKVSLQDAALTHLPDQSRARALVGSRWGRVDVQGGKLRHESRRFPGAWSTTSLLVRARGDILIHADSYEYGGAEIFGLRIRCSSEPWSSDHIESARPAFGTLLEWPPGLRLPRHFTEVGPDSGEAGLGPAVRTSSHETCVPLLWLVLRARDDGLLVFADCEIPFNVGIANLDAMSPVLRALRAASTLKL